MHSSPWISMYVHDKTWSHSHWYNNKYSSIYRKHVEIEAGGGAFTSKLSNRAGQGSM